MLDSPEPPDSEDLREPLVSVAFPERREMLDSLDMEHLDSLERRVCPESLASRAAMESLVFLDRWDFLDSLE